MRPASASSQSGFTLIEILLAITIFVLVIGSIYASLFAGVNALYAGRASMEIYQTSRAGMNRILKDLRKALSPASFPYEEEEEELLDPEGFDYYEGYAEEGEEELQIVFRGSSDQFECAIRQEISDEDGPSLDIRQIRYRMGEDEENTVVKEIFRSILVARLEDTLRRRHEERHGPESFFAPNATSGYFEKPIVQTICDGVTDLEFSYFNGVEWESSWDSEEVVINDFSQDLGDDLLGEEDEEKVGLPQLVKVKMTLENGIVLEAATDIPGSELNVLGPVGRESDFSSAFRGGRERLRRLRERARERGYSRSTRRRSRFY